MQLKNNFLCQQNIVNTYRTDSYFFNGKRCQKQKLPPAIFIGVANPAFRDLSCFVRRRCPTEVFQNLDDRERFASKPHFLYRADARRLSVVGDLRRACQIRRRAVQNL